MTNYDRIKSMSVEEVFDLITESNCYHCSENRKGDCECTCDNGVKKWLESEVVDEQIY